MTKSRSSELRLHLEDVKTRDSLTLIACTLLPFIPLQAKIKTMARVRAPLLLSIQNRSSAVASSKKRRPFRRSELSLYLEGRDRFALRSLFEDLS